MNAACTKTDSIKMGKKQSKAKQRSLCLSVSHVSHVSQSSVHGRRFRRRKEEATEEGESERPQFCSELHLRGADSKRKLMEMEMEMEMEMVEMEMVEMEMEMVEMVEVVTERTESVMNKSPTKFECPSCVQ
jgi:hypothetical protein